MRAHRLFPLFVLLLAVLTESSPADPSFSTGAAAGGKQALTAHNPAPCVETVTISATLANATCSKQLPFTMELPAGATQELCTFGPGAPNVKWHYDYKWESHPGSPAARHDDRIVYALPYPKGKTYKVIQGFLSPFSHTGEYSYATDWNLPPGSQICAARDGVVAKVKADSDEGGPSRDFIKKANYISIVHPDGTLGEYLHLQRGGALVKVGQRVKAGDVIGLSGNTGFTSGPHLHFHVSIPVDGTKIRTVPIKFHTTTAPAEQLKEGSTYAAP